MNTTQSKTNHVFLILTIVVGIISVIPQIFYQPFLLQGDHGRDLYVFQQTAHGAIPYIDYQTDNGPLMPYYYALFLINFKESLQSVLAGYALLIFIAGFLIFLIARKLLPPWMALLCAVWYWAWRGQEFFYTFNHIGAIVTGLATIHFTITSIKLRRKRYFLLGVFSSFLCMLIRPDIGIAALAGLFFCSFLFQQKDQLPSRSFFIISSTIIAGAVILLNIFIPEMILPYWNAIQWDRIPQNILLLCGIWISFLSQNFFIARLSSVLALMMISGIVHLWRARQEEAAQNIWRLLGVFSIFFILFLMEFLLGFRFFRWVWVMPISFLIIFHTAYFGIIKLNRTARILIYSLLSLICAIFIALPYNDLSVSKHHNAMLHVGSSHVYLRTDQIPWINTVKETSDFILANTSPDEPILAIPYDAIYCFLTSRPLATPNPSLFGHKGDGIIRQIEQHHVRLILISNRAFHNNESRLLGILGETYGKSLLSYIYQNYELAAQFGPWEQSATVINNHATRIYQRKTPFQGTQK